MEGIDTLAPVGGGIGGKQESHAVEIVVHRGRVVVPASGDPVEEGIEEKGGVTRAFAGIVDGLTVGAAEEQDLAVIEEEGTGFALGAELFVAPRIEDSAGGEDFGGPGSKAVAAGTDEEDAGFICRHTRRRASRGGRGA